MSVGIKAVETDRTDAERHEIAVIVLRQRRDRPDIIVNDADIQTFLCLSRQNIEDRVPHPAFFNDEVFEKNDRTIGFSNCERYFAKGVRAASPVFARSPALGPTSPNDFLTKLFAEYNAKATAEVEQNAVDQAAYEAAMVEGTAIIASIVDADTANAAMPKYQALKHALTSNKELGVLWNKKIKECGLFFDKVLKKYTPAPEEAKEAE